MRQTNGKCKYRSRNYDQFDHRGALKTFLQPSFFLNGYNEGDYVEEILENPMVAKFATANHSAYRTVTDHALKTFVDNNGGTLTNITIRGINDHKLQYVMENPSPFSLLFKDKYNFNERNPKTRSILDIGRYHLERDFRKKVEREMKKLRQKRSHEFDENGTRIYKD